MILHNSLSSRLERQAKAYKIKSFKAASFGLGIALLTLFLEYAVPSLPIAILTILAALPVFMFSASIYFMAISHHSKKLATRYSVWPPVLTF